MKQILALAIIFLLQQTQAGTLECRSESNIRGEYFKIIELSEKTFFGVKKQIKIYLSDSSGLEIDSISHYFNVDNVSRRGNYTKVEATWMVNVGGGISGMTNFNSLTLEIDNTTKKGRANIIRSYQDYKWTFYFTCSKTP